MSFLPQFLNLTSAAVAAAVAIPLLLVLYFLKLRRVTMPVGSTLLWKKAIQDLQVNSPFQKLRRNVLLLLQLLALLALLLALARPVSEGTPLAGAKSVILLDHSASMNARDGDNGGTRLDEAKRRANVLVGTMKPGATAMVISVADELGTSIAQSFTGDAQSLRNAIDNVPPTDRPTRLKTAYGQANANMQFDRVNELAADKADVFLFSDGRVPQSDAAQLSLQGDLHYEKVGKTDTKNLAVVAASARRNYERPTEVQVFARVNNFGPDPAAAKVRVSVARIDPADPAKALDYKPVSLAPIDVSVPPARWTDADWKAANPDAAKDLDAKIAAAPRIDSVDVKLDLTEAAVLKIELVDANDALADDDAAWVVVPPPAPLKVMLVTRGNYVWEKLLTVLPLNEPKTVTPEQYEAAPPTDFNVVVFDDYSPKALPPSGTFVYSGGLPPAGSSDVKPVTNEAGVELFYGISDVLDWARDHPMLQGLSLSRIFVKEGRLLTVPVGATQLIEGVKGPMLILERKGPRTNVIFSFELLESDWPIQKTFPIFAYQMFQYLAAGEDVRVRESVPPGSVVSVPRSALDRAKVSQDGGTVKLIDPSGGSRTLPAGGIGSLAVDGLDRVGVYRTEPVLPQFERIAVSLLDETESNLLPSPTDPGNLSGVEPAQAAADEKAGGGVRDVEWWWWLVAAAAGVLTLEWVVYTRRVGT